LSRDENRRGLLLYPVDKSPRESPRLHQSVNPLQSQLQRPGAVGATVRRENSGSLDDARHLSSLKNSGVRQLKSEEEVSVCCDT
jgi:hypothetical protein